MFLDELLRQSTKKYPNKEAVRDSVCSITYNELDRKSDLLAYELNKRKEDFKEPIGIYMDKTVQCVVTVFAVLKSGSAYVPIDKTLPDYQIQSIIKSAGIKIVVTDIEGTELLAEQIIVFKQIEKGKVDVNSAAVTTKDRSEKDAAYILYTSGSTGVPKGIEISHKASLAFVKWAAKQLKITSEDIFSSHAPFSFDLSIFDIYCSLSSGATLVLLPYGISAFPKTLCQFIYENNISVWYSVPSILMKMSEIDIFEKCKETLRIIIYAGESMPVKYAGKLMRMFSKAEVYNFYGPTETNVITYHKLNIEDLEFEQIPIGKACPYADIQIRDCALDNGHGELIVKTESLMNGYRGREEISSNEYYRTGDIVSTIGNEEYVYIGRLDHMVKVNGFRVELEEIEHVIEEYPGVSGCVVKYEEGERDILRAVVETNEIIKETELKKYLSKMLQPYKQPAVIEFCSSMEVTARGKKQR